VAPLLPATISLSSTPSCPRSRKIGVKYQHDDSSMQTISYYSGISAAHIVSLEVICCKEYGLKDDDIVHFKVEKEKKDGW
jgi:hypothetical protein